MSDRPEGVNREWEAAYEAIETALSDPQGIMLHSWESVRRAWRAVRQHIESLTAENERLRTRKPSLCEACPHQNTPDCHASHKGCTVTTKERIESLTERADTPQGYCPDCGNAFISTAAAIEHLLKENATIRAAAERDAAVVEAYEAALNEIAAHTYVADDGYPAYNDANRRMEIALTALAARGGDESSALATSPDTGQGERRTSDETTDTTGGDASDR